MKKLRDAAVLLLVIAAFGISLRWLARAVGVTSPLFVVIATCDFMGAIAFARPWMLLTLPRSLQPVQAWEIKSGFYRLLGVPLFGTLLRGSPLRYLNSMVYLRQWHGDCAAVGTQMEAAEAAHLLAIAVTVPYVLYAVMQNRWSALVGIVIFNVAVNVYPVLHLRWVRGRLARVRDAKLLVRSRTRPLAARAN